MATIESRPLGVLPGKTGTDFDWFFSQFDSDASVDQLAHSPSPVAPLSKPCRADVGNADACSQLETFDSPDPPGWSPQDLGWDSPPELITPVRETLLGSEQVLEISDFDAQLDSLEDFDVVPDVFTEQGDLLDSLLDGSLDNAHAWTNGRYLQATGEKNWDNSLGLSEKHAAGAGEDLEEGASVGENAASAFMQCTSTSCCSGSYSDFRTASASIKSASGDSGSGNILMSSPRTSYSGSSNAYPATESTSSWGVDAGYVHTLLAEDVNRGETWESQPGDWREATGNVAGPLVVRPSGMFQLPSGKHFHAAKQEPCVDGCGCSSCEQGNQGWQDIKYVGDAFPSVGSMGSMLMDSGEVKPMPLVVQATKPTRPADMSDRLAALVGPISKEEVVKARSLPGLSVIGESINTATVRPPSTKARAPKVMRSGAVRTGRVKTLTPKVEIGKPFLQGSHADAPLGIRKLGKSSLQSMSTVAENLVSFPVFPRSDMAISTSIVARGAGEVGLPQDGVLKQQLISLAEAMATDDQARVRFLTNVLREDAQPQGSAIQRMVFRYMSALASKAAGTGAQQYTAPLKTSVLQLAQAMKSCSQKMPYMDFVHTASNAAILDEVMGESKVHIVDIGMWQGVQLLKLMQQLAVQPGGPPHLRVTGVQTPWTGNLFKGAMTSAPAVIGRELTKVAAELNIPFEFHTVDSRMENLRPFMIRQEPGEAMVALCAMRMYQLVDQTVVRSSPRDTTLQFVRQLAPRLFVLMDMDADLNGPFFMERFRESVEFYAAHFESQAAIFSGRPCESREPFEDEYLGREIINVVACEGLQRVVRTEKLEKWHTRLSRMGFNSVSFSSKMVTIVERMLTRHPKEFGVATYAGGGVRLTWNGRPMVFSSLWRPLF